MLKVFQYIFYPPAFVKEMRAFRVTEFSVFLLFLIGLLLGTYWYWEFGTSQAQMLFSILFCLFAYGLYVYYKVSWMPFLTLYFSIGAIVAVWSYIAESFFYKLADHFMWEIGSGALVLGYVLWSVIYLVLFHAICRDMEDKRSEGMVVVRKG